MICCDCTGAFLVVEEVMLQEAFDLPSTRILSLYTLGHFLAAKPQLTVSDLQTVTGPVNAMKIPFEMLHHL